MAALMCGAWCATAQTTENGHEYVDLGLPSGTKWATCNVGATKPEEYGNYYAWGETEPKDYYDWSTYKYGSDYDELTKYCTSSDYGTVDNKNRTRPGRRCCPCQLGRRLAYAYRCGMDGTA